MMRELLPSLNNLPVFYTVAVSLFLMLLIAGISLYQRVFDDSTSQQTLFWSKLVVSIPLLVLGAVWTYLGAYTLGFVALLGGTLIFFLLALACIFIYAITTWGLIRWIRNKRLGDISVIIVVVTFATIIYSYQRAYLCEPLAHSGYGFAQLCTAKLYETGTGGVVARRATARDWYRDAAHSGYASAQYWMGMHTRNVDERKEWLIKATDQGHAPAAYQMFLVLRPEDDQALEWLQFAADKDYPPALYRLGLLHSSGYLVAYDLERARELSHRAAKAGHTTSMRSLAIAYARGVIFDIDLNASGEWEQKAIAASVNEDIKKLPADERHFAQTWQTQLAQLREQATAIAANDPVAIRQLSHDILAHAKDDPAQREKGIRLLEQSAESSPDDQYIVADYYLDLNTPDKDNMEKGLGWLVKAAENDHRMALRRLIEAHKEGIYGFTADLYKAKHYSEQLFAVLEKNDVPQNNAAWFSPTWDYQDTLKQIKRIESLPLSPEKLKEKADAGDPEAQYFLAKDISFYGNDFERSQTLLKTSAQGGYPQAQYEMASRIFNHKRTKEEEHQAMVWLRDAAAEGHRGALVWLGDFYASGSKRQEIERNYYQAKVYYERAVKEVDNIVYEQKTSPTRAWHITVDSVNKKLQQIPDYIMRLDLEGLEGQSRITAINDWYEQEQATLDANMNSAADEKLSGLVTALSTLQSQRETLLNSERG